MSSVPLITEPANTEPRLITFGCWLNRAESDAICRHAAAAGLGEASIVYTCGVRGQRYGDSIWPPGSGVRLTCSWNGTGRDKRLTLRKSRCPVCRPVVLRAFARPL